MTAWSDYLEADRQIFAARWRVVSEEEDATGLLRAALGRASERGAALRLLLTLDTTVSMDLLEDLVDLASAGHAEVDLVRQAIGRIPSGFLDGWLWGFIEPFLAESDDGPYRRFAELLEELERPEELEQLVTLASTSDDEHVREVGQDYVLGFYAPE